METLSGIFPKPSLFIEKLSNFFTNLIIIQKLYVFFLVEVPPKRDFIKENRIKLKELQRQKSTAKPTPPNNPPNKTTTTLNKKLLQRKASVNQFNDVPNNRVPRSSSSNRVKLAKSSTSIASRPRPRLSRSCSSSSRSRSGAGSACSSSTTTTRDTSSQTIDVNDSLFLKDVIIRLPSASVLKQLEIEANAHANKVDEQPTKTHAEVPFESEQLTSNECSAVYKKPIRPLDEHDILRNAQIDKLAEFTQRQSISKPKKPMYMEGDDQPSTSGEGKRRQWFNDGDKRYDLNGNNNRRCDESAVTVRKIDVPDSKIMCNYIDRICPISYFIFLRI